MEFNQPSQTIIQVGVVIGNLTTGEILDRYQECVYTEEQINPYITQLTGINQDDVTLGKFLPEIYEDLKVLHDKYNCFRNALTWGGGDSDYLRKGLGLDEDNFLFGRRWIDAKTLFVSRCFASDQKHQSGLAKSMSRLGMKFIGTKHQAEDDAYNTFLIYRRLLLDMKIKI